MQSCHKCISEPCFCLSLHTCFSLALPQGRSLLQTWFLRCRCEIVGMQDPYQPLLWRKEGRNTISWRSLRKEVRIRRRKECPTTPPPTWQGALEHASYQSCLLTGQSGAPLYLLLAPAQDLGCLMRWEEHDSFRTRMAQVHGAEQALAGSSVLPLNF